MRRSLPRGISGCRYSCNPPRIAGATIVRRRPHANPERGGAAGGTPARPLAHREASERRQELAGSSSCLGTSSLFRATQSRKPASSNSPDAAAVTFSAASRSARSRTKPFKPGVTSSARNPARLLSPTKGWLRGCRGTKPPRGRMRRPAVPSRPGSAAASPSPKPLPAPLCCRGAPGAPPCSSKASACKSMKASIGGSSTGALTGPRWRAPSGNGGWPQGSNPAHQAHR